MKTKRITFTLLFCVIVLLAFVAIYNRDTRDYKNKYVLKDVERRNHLMKYLRGTKYTYKSTGNLSRQNGVNVDEKNSVSLHVFDFINMTVTNKSIVDGKVKIMTYPIMRYSKDPRLHSTHVLKIESSGLNEIRLNSQINTIEYYYNTGKVLVYQNATREASYDLLSLKL